MLFYSQWMQIYIFNIDTNIDIAYNKELKSRSASINLKSILSNSNIDIDINIYFICKSNDLYPRYSLLNIKTNNFHIMKSLVTPVVTRAQNLCLHEKPFALSWKSIILLQINLWKTFLNFFSL